jgi:hypothetical protein
VSQVWPQVVPRRAISKGSAATHDQNAPSRPLRSVHRSREPFYPAKQRANLQACFSRRSFKPRRTIKFLLHVYLTAGLLWSNTTKTSQTSDIVLLLLQRQDGTVTEELVARTKSKERIRGASTILECGYCRSVHVLQSRRSRRVQTCPPQLWFQRALFFTLTQKRNENERARRPSIASCGYHQQTMRWNIILFYTEEPETVTSKPGS